MTWIGGVLGLADVVGETDNLDGGLDEDGVVGRPADLVAGDFRERKGEIVEEEDLWDLELVVVVVPNMEFRERKERGFSRGRPRREEEPCYRS